MGKEGKTKEEAEEKWFVTKLCVKDGVVKDGVCKMVSKIVCERWCVTKWCVKDHVPKMVCAKDGV